MPSASPETRPDTRPDTRRSPDAPRAWNVVLLNDDDHSYEYVIAMVQKVFGHPTPKANQIARTVDTQGRAICITTHKELAELKRDQIHAYGADPLVRESKGSMSAVIEPADFGDGDDE